MVNIKYRQRNNILEIMYYKGKKSQCQFEKHAKLTIPKVIKDTFENILC